MDFEKRVWEKYEEMRGGWEAETSARMDEMKVNLAEFEAKVREEYDRKVQEFLEMQRKVWDSKEHQAQEERDRQDAAAREKMRQTELARIEFEDDIRKKYQALMASEQEHWKQLEEERGKRGKDATDRIEKEYMEKRSQDDIERKEFEQKLLAKFDADKRALEE